MELRESVEVKIYKLYLNDMRSPNIEMLKIAAIGVDREELINWYNKQLCDMYRDDYWLKTFEPGSALEWFNPCSQQSLQDSSFSHFGEGIHEEWVPIETFLSIMEHEDLFVCESEITIPGYI